MSIKAH